jgi:hypothetical protein
MDKNEFKRFVIENAKKYISESIQKTTEKSLEETSSKTTVEAIDPKQIKMLAEEMKKINKKIDLRNPLINPELFDIISEENIISKEVVKESQKDKWKSLYNYNIPTDDKR